MNGLSAIEVILANLHLLSPSEVLASPQASDSFKTFFKRSSPNECNRLLPQGWRLTVEPAECNRPRLKQPREATDRGSKGAASIEPQRASRDGSLESTLSNNQQSTSADDDLEVETLSTPRNVAKALKALRTGAPDLEYCKIWSERGELFGGAEESPCRRLVQGQDKFNKEGMMNKCVGRFISLFISHEIDARTHGRRTSAAMELYAKETGQSLKDVKSQLRNSAKYEELLLRIGPGILLILGDAVRSLWEFHITCEDLERFLIDLKTHHHQVYGLATRLNEVGGRFALEGLRAYRGSTFDSLSSVKSRLRVGLFRHCSRSVTLPWTDPGIDPRQVDEDQRREKRRRQKKNRRQKTVKASAHSSTMSLRENVDINGGLVPCDAGLATSNQNPEPTDNAQWNGQALDDESLNMLAENTSDWPWFDQSADRGEDINLSDSNVFQLPDSDFFHVDTTLARC